MQGIVIRNTGNSYVVRLEAGDEVSCKVKGNRVFDRINLSLAEFY